ncbi:MAG: sulfatase-like hydrolase/transferase [Akkermansiaceae bacterium]
MENASDHPRSRRHAWCWLGGAVLVFLPFLIPIATGFPRPSWVEGPGYFGENVILATWWLLGGMILGGLIGKFSGGGRFPQKVNFHWLWFALTMVVFTMHNFLVLDGYQFTGAEKVSTMMGRIFTGVIIIGLYWLACAIAGALAPKRWSHWPWLIAAMIPVVLLSDFIAMLMWKNPLLNIVNVIDSNGKFDLGSALAGGGVSVPAWIVGVGFIILVLAMHRLFLWTAKVPLQRKTIVISLLVMFAGIWAEKAIGMTWKSRNALRWEHHSFDIHFTTGFEPPLGVIEYKVTFNERFQLDPAAGSEVQKRPDIFIIMIESLRQDAIQPKHAPFLSKFREEECQNLGTTSASANATMLSWYGLFHGVLPVYWPGERHRFHEEETAPLPVWFQVLKNAGYRSEVRTVGDLSFMNISETSFGSDRSQFAEFIDAPEGEVHWKDYYKQIPDREKAAFSAVQESLQANPVGGNFHFIALDSTHWGYFWPDDFQLPYPEYFDGGSPPAFPDGDDIISLKNRYFNAVAWVDSQIAEFVDFLKTEERYKDSLLLITGDHGEEFHEHGGWFHSSSLMPVQTQVPLLIKWPEGTKAPSHSSASHLDLLPSVMDHLGISGHERLPGVSLLKPSSVERTQMTFACNTGVSGVCMAWYRDGWTATFRWKNPWSHQPPKHVYLDDILDPMGKSVRLSEESAWDSELKKRFPDAAARLFRTVELVPDAP